MKRSKLSGAVQVIDRPVSSKSQSAPGRRRILLAFALLLAAGVSWAVFELVFWSQIPNELVGKWVVEGGSQDGATFDFSRSGKLEARLNNRGRADMLIGTVRVTDQKMFITTKNRMGNDETNSCAIRELTPERFTVEFSAGEVFRMVRAR